MHNGLERDVEIPTPDGQADAVLFHPTAEGRWPAVLVWPDIGDLRPALREIGRRLAEDGHVVLVVNPYYRHIHAAALTAIPAGPEQQAARQAGRATLLPDAVARDALAYVGWLDALPQSSAAKIGVQGYCMGGALSVRTAAAAPDRIAAVASFHGGAGLVGEDATSPHRLIARTHAAYLFATARNDDEKQPATAIGLARALDEAGRRAIVEIYAADHGWCVSDHPRYDAPEAERAWGALRDLYRRTLI